MVGTERPRVGWWGRERVAVVIAGLGACFLAGTVGQVLRSASPYPVGDFFALWSSARVLASEAAGAVYDAPLLHALQLGMGLDTGDANPYPYPPHAALLLLPLAGLGYWAAAGAWLLGGLAAYAWALAGGRGGEARWVVLAAVLAPTTALNLAFGQGGFLVGALLIGGLRLAGVRPVMAGVLFGVLTFKPQFGLMVPVALVAAGHWRCAGAAAWVAAGLAGVATAWQGWGIWDAWLASLPGYQAWFEMRSLGVMPTVGAGLQMLGVPRTGVHAAQAAAAAVAAGCVWLAWRSGDAARVPITLAATALATPHGFVYDLPLLSGGVILFAGQRLRERGGLGAWEAAGLLAALAFPGVMAVSRIDLPIAPPLLLLALGSFVHGGCGREREGYAGAGRAAA